MRCFVVVFLAVLAGTCASSPGSALCAQHEHFFARHNASADDGEIPGPVCGGPCCGRTREARLESAARRGAGTRAVAAVRPVADLILSMRRTLQEHLTALSYQSQNKTWVLFSKIYRSQASRVHTPLVSLYEDIRELVRSNSDVINGEDLGSPPPRDLTLNTKKFFKEIFPTAYQNILRLDGKQFTPEYESCLKDAYETVQPFGEVPQQLGSSLSKSLEASRILLQMLAMGAGVLAASEHILSMATEHCSAKLLRVSGCASCRGLDARPCRNFCLNVARGCVGWAAWPLEAPWAGYVAGVERVARPDADGALRALSTTVSTAVMHALETHLILEKKVRQECGPPATTESSTATAVNIGGNSDSLRVPPPDAELLQFAASLSATTKLFATVADYVCDAPDFAHHTNTRCWNGEDVGDYVKSLVASGSANDQKYNPEVSSLAPSDPAALELAERLRKGREVSAAWGGGDGGTPAAEAFMQGDAAGEGSGSGRGLDDDASYDAEGSGDDGSGEHPGLQTYPGEDKSVASTPKVSAGISIRPIRLVSLVAILLAYPHLLS